MIFQEHKLEAGFRYSVEAADGKVDIRTTQKLTAHQLEKIGAVIFPPSVSGERTVPGESATPGLKKGQCPHCLEFKASPFPMTVMTAGFAATIPSVILLIFFPPLGILLCVFSLAAIFIGPVVAHLAKPNHVFCLNCNQLSELPTTP